MVQFRWNSQVSGKRRLRFALGAVVVSTTGLWVRAQAQAPPFAPPPMRIRLGATFTENDRVGVRVHQVYPGMPASRLIVPVRGEGGQSRTLVGPLDPGDLILFIDGRPVRSVPGLREMLDEYPSGSRLEIAGLNARLGGRRPFLGHVILGEAAPPIQGGVYAAPIPPSNIPPSAPPGPVNDPKRYYRSLLGAVFAENESVGVVVESVDADGPAMRLRQEANKPGATVMQLVRGDLITFANDRPVRSVDDLHAIAAAVGPGGTLKLSGLDASYNWARTYHLEMTLGRAADSGAVPPPPPTPVEPSPPPS